MKHFFEQLKSQLVDKKPFVAYRKPNDFVVKAVLQNSDDLHYTWDYKETGFVFAPFNAKNDTVLIPLDTLLTAPYTPEGNSNENTALPLNTFATPIAKEFHTKLVTSAITNLAKGKLQKVVVSRKIEVGCSKKSLPMFKAMLDKYPTAFCYLWYHPKVGMWLGATPEVLLKTENQRIETSSLAGTQVWTKDEVPEWKSKEKYEQKVVTDFIVNALENKVSNLKLSTVTSIKAGNLWHLRTRITGLMSNNLKEILLALHPTPATCGLPKKEAQAFILKNENYDRTFYTGFLGELNYSEENHRANARRNIENRAYTVNKKTTNIYANLRCAELKENKAFVYVGGGITIDSNPEKEWEETVAKSETILRIILK
ncbi:chorismate-binding protein [Cellulophaga sp. F20128]|uniref:chorismate-binding protein n=1 Tax=Cellulophaga sp. F20128 TaxID=2926413 RepID=UPI001FF33D45|nr:chorismate-binding protein [Cellulophaga sp. F20128]MCK0156631.1 chorismate-binding protein [Cellulophaga sp. F20128]